ncbi:hypothetical protein FisN_1Hu063 [Fistulifera solaris]|uniref:Peptidase S1 domain-containing protein n=1 Tax=Fistulifera solaris TaxID=1519565 RepID=A0A1Z5JED8_FISSO|nr:hypothetical protein FisN_1Hu063 [Fistulifera solaris]|eukprot:GAX12138.1 hypothetical protein FisN_1Hu063 [Fistulifera solaris]
MKAFCLLFFFFGAACSQVLEQIGDIFPIRFRSNGASDIKGTDTPLGKSYVLTHPGATYIALRFSKLNLLSGDSIEVTDANGGQAYTLTGTGKGKGAAFWSQHIKGDTIVLNTMITSRNWRRSSVFDINQYAAGFEPLTETICGADDKANAACYTSTFPTEYSKSRAVARLLINGNSLCTGFLVSGSNHLLTNNHCIKTAADALNTDYDSGTSSCSGSSSCRGACSRSSPRARACASTCSGSSTCSTSRSGSCSGTGSSTRARAVASKSPCPCGISCPHSNSPGPNSYDSGMFEVERRLLHQFQLLQWCLQNQQTMQVNYLLHKVSLSMLFITKVTIQ